MPHFYGLPLDLCGKRIAVLFAKCTAIFGNASNFHRKSAAILGKAPQSKDCGTLQDGALSGIAESAAALISAAAACLLHSV